MLHGMYNGLIAMKMELMEKSMFDFFLTGSRYFGNVHKDSDWDFFVQDNLALPQFLKDLGFIKETSDDTDIEPIPYGDSNTVSVWTYYAKERGGIHIQISKDVNAKKAAQLILAGDPKFMISEKGARVHYWNKAMNLAQSILAIERARPNNYYQSR